MNRVGLAILVVLAAACPPAIPFPAGCGKDTDCKGSRICVANACIDPPKAKSANANANANVNANANGNANANADGGAPGPSVDLGAADLASPPPLGASPMFHGDALHTGRSRFRAPQTQPREVMHVATGGVVYSSPAIGDDVLVFGSHDRSIYATSLDGTIRWRRPTGDLVWSAPALGSGGVAYVGSDDDHLYALDLKDGSLKWQLTAGPCRTAVGSGPEAARCDVDGVTVAPDGTIYASADGLYALRPDGSLKWKFSPGPTHCASSAAVGPDGTVYVGCQDDALYALDPGGVKLWELRAGDDVDSSPSVAPDGTVYVGSDDHRLYALGPGGVVRFAVTTGGAVRSSPAQGPDGTIYVGSFDGSLYAVKPGGAVAWSFRAADRILGSPLVDAAGLIVFGAEDDRLYALAPDGKLQWSVLLDGDVDGTPALGADGTLYVGSDDRALHALR
ncbi:MAG TPA: PQQ-binding-like beta-propeller repeat protein [Polyangia bacterium]|nr:PQQ-binding-like beta-propeller repeat protein [Polyangia bacterium]